MSELEPAKNLWKGRETLTESRQPEIADKKIELLISKAETALAQGKDISEKTLCKLIETTIPALYADIKSPSFYYAEKAWQVLHEISDVQARALKKAYFSSSLFLKERLYPEKINTCNDWKKIVDYAEFDWVTFLDLRRRSLKKIKVNKKQAIEIERVLKLVSNLSAVSNTAKNQRYQLLVELAGQYSFDPKQILIVGNKLVEAGSLSAASLDVYIGYWLADDTIWFQHLIEIASFGSNLNAIKDFGYEAFILKQIEKNKLDGLHGKEVQKINNPTEGDIMESDTGIVPFEGLKGERREKGSETERMEVQFVPLLKTAIKLGAKFNNKSNSLYISELLESNADLAPFMEQARKLLDKNKEPQ